METGKTTKYFKYAIGEIILVVIGILIALQINNWNENQKQNKQETVYLQNLNDDLLSQIQALETYIEFENIIIEDTDAIIKHYELNNGFHNMDSIYPKINDLAVRWTFNNLNVTLLEMINSGQINLISNAKLKKELIEFNQLINRFSINTQNNNTNLIDLLIVPNVVNYTNYASTGYTKRMQNKFRDYYPIDFVSVQDNQLNNLAVQFMNEPKFKLQLINNISFRRAMASIQKSGNEGLKAKANELKKHLEAEIKQ
jgi:hypothetical protein